MFDSVLERYPDLKKTEIASRLKVKPQEVSNNLNPNRSLPIEFVDAFINEFGLRKEYFETETGSIFKDDYEVEAPGQFKEPSEPYPIKESQNSRKQDIVTPKGTLHTTGANKRKDAALIPFYNADFIAGNAELYYDDEVIHPEYLMDIPEFSGCTAFRAYSDSMENLIRSGSILFGVKLENWRDHLDYGQIYGITLADGRRYLKRIRKSDKKDCFKIVSENPKYDDSDLPIKMIKNIWLIEGWLDKRT